MSFSPPSLHALVTPLLSFNHHTRLSRIGPENAHTLLSVCPNVCFFYVFSSTPPLSMTWCRGVTVFSAHLHEVCHPHLSSLFYQPWQTIMSQRKLSPRSFSYLYRQEIKIGEQVTCSCQATEQKSWVASCHLVVADWKINIFESFAHHLQVWLMWWSY